MLREVVESGMKSAAWEGGSVSSARRRAAILAWLMPTALAPMWVGKRWVRARMGMVGLFCQWGSVWTVSLGVRVGCRRTMAQVVRGGWLLVAGVWLPSMAMM